MGNNRLFARVFLLALLAFSPLAFAVDFLNVTLTGPANNSNFSSNSIVFTYVPSDQNDTNNPTPFRNYTSANVSIGNLTALAAGVVTVNWNTNVTGNASVIINGSSNTITVSGLSAGYYVWNVNVTNATPATAGIFNMSATNRTFNVDSIRPPYFVLSGSGISNNSNFSTLAVNVSFTPGDDRTLVENTTVWILLQSNGTFLGSVTNTTATGVNNGTLLNTGFGGISGLVSGSKYNFTIQVCDYSNLCVNHSIVNVTFDTAAPGYFVSTYPTNASNQSATNFNVSFTPGDAIGAVANTTVWLRREDNGTFLGSVANTSNVGNGSLLVTGFGSLAGVVSGVKYNFTYQLCDFANNCVNHSIRNVTVDNVAPDYFVSTLVNNSNQTSTYVNASFTPGDALTAVINTTVWLINVNGTYVSSFTNASTTNGTQIIGGFVSAPAGTYNLSFQLCDYANNCANFTRRITVDPNLPNYFVPGYPVNGSNQSATNFNVTFTPGDANGAIANTTVWIRLQSNGTFLTTNDNVNTTIVNGTMLVTGFASLAGVVSGSQYNFTIQVCDFANNCVNHTITTVTIDSVAPLPTILDTPANTSNFSSNFINFSFTPRDAVTGAANTTIWVFNSTGVRLNATTNTTITNGTPVVLGITIMFPRGNSTYNYTVQACDYANNCFNTTSGTFTIDNSPPEYFISTTPISNNQTSRYVNVSFTPGDAQTAVANTTVFARNFNGTIQTTVTNTSVLNGTLLITALTALPDGDYNLTYQLCDVANNCVNYSSVSFVTIDNVVPLINYTTGSTSNGQALSSTTLFINVTVTESHFGNITLQIDGVNYTGRLTEYPVNSGFYNTTETVSHVDTHTFRVYVSDKAGNFNATPQFSATGPPSGGSSSAASGGGGGGTGVSTAQATPTPAPSPTPAPTEPVTPTIQVTAVVQASGDSAVAQIASISEGETAVVLVPSAVTQSTGVRVVSITSSASATNVEVTVASLAARPTEIRTAPAAQRTLRYVSLDSNAQVQRAFVEFQVEQSALRGASRDQVQLQRFSNGRWKPLTTRFVRSERTSDGRTILVFSALTPGFSVFAITIAEPTATPLPAPTVEAMMEEKEPPAPSPAPRAAGGLDFTAIAIIVVIAILAAFGYKKFLGDSGKPGALHHPRPPRPLHGFKPRPSKEPPWTKP